MKTLFAVTRTRGQAWDESKPMRSQVQWDEHATFMEQLVANGFVVLGGPIGDDGEVLLVCNAPDENAILTALADDPWSPMGMLEVKNIRQWTILLDGGDRAY